MSNKKNEKPAETAPATEEVPIEAVTPAEPLTDIAVRHEAASEGEFEEPGAPLPSLPYEIEELGIQPVSLASKTWASSFGPGGAAHRYKIAVYGEGGEIAHQAALSFQKGATGEGGELNGIADSTLLSILADRWSAFQAGPFASEETGKALECIQQAAAWLNQRTADRQKRGVEGKHEA